MDGCAKCCLIGSTWTGTFIAVAIGAVAVTGLAIGILGLMQSASLATVSTTSIVTSVLNPLTCWVPVIFGALGLAQLVPIGIVSGFLIATQAFSLLMLVPLIMGLFTTACASFSVLS